MRDYFASIIFSGVPKGTEGTKPINTRDSGEFSSNTTVPLRETEGVLKGTKIKNNSTPSTLIESERVPEKARITADVPLVPLSTPLTETFEERAAIIEYDANIPRIWAEAFARMDCSPKPLQLTPSCWQRIKNATGVLLDNHIHALIAHSWQVADIFGCHPVAPEGNYSVMGLVFLMANMEVTHIDAEAITLKTPGRAVQKYRKSQQDYNKVMVWELNVEKE